MQIIIIAIRKLLFSINYAEHLLHELTHSSLATAFEAGTS